MHTILQLFLFNRIGDVMVSVFASSVVDRGFVGDVMVSVLSSSVVDRGFVGSNQRLLKLVCVDSPEST